MENLDFDKSFKIVVDVEGGYSKDQSDPGNWTSGKVGVGNLKGTKYGISAAAYHDEDIANLTLDRAKFLYNRDYWIRASCDKLNWPLNLVVFDGAVQHDPVDAKILLQKAVGVKVDGFVGPNTLAAITRYGDKESAVLMLRRRVEYYQSLKSFAKYGDGWLNRLFRVALAA